MWKLVPTLDEKHRRLHVSLGGDTVVELVQDRESGELQIPVIGDHARSLLERGMIRIFEDAAMRIGGGMEENVARIFRERFFDALQSETKTKLKFMRGVDFVV